MRKMISMILCLIMLLTIVPSARAENVQVMTADEFIGYLYVALNRKTKYSNVYPNNVGYYDGTYISWDCWHLGETIIATRGEVVNNYTTGAKASAWMDNSIGLSGQSGDWLKGACKDTLSSDFSNIVPGEWLFRDRDGSCYHVGYYVGNDQVIEITTDGTSNVQLTTIDGQGHSNLRSNSWTWTYHAKVPWITYCSHNSAYYNDGRCTNCGAWLPNQNDNASCTVGTYRVVSGKTAYFRAHPYRVSDETIGELLGSLSAGTQVSVTGAVVNGLGNTWYMVSYNGQTGYIVNDSLEFVAAEESTLTISTPDADYTARTGLPSGSIVGGKSWGLRGTISSNYQLTKVECHIYNSSGNDAVTAYVNNNPNTKSYDIKAGGMDKAIPFSGLANGDYQIVISAWDASMVYRDVVSWFSIVPADVTTYTVSYDANGGAGAPGNQTKTQGTALTLSSTVPTRTMYVFKGWSTSSSGSVQYQPGGSYTADANVTLYAVWEKGTYTITYDANGGTGAPETQTFTYNSGEHFSTVVPTRTGYTFVNWKDDWDGGYYNPGDPIPDGWGSNKLIAQWSVNYYTLDVNSWIDNAQGWEIRGYGVFDLYINGNLEMAGDGDYCTTWPYGTTYEIRNIRMNDGYSFDGFLTDPDIDYGTGFTNKGRTGTITGSTSVNMIVHTCPTSLDEAPEPAIFGGHTYYYFSTPVTWYDAKTLCENMGGHLVTATSDEETSFLVNLVKDHYKEESGCYIWLGATDRDSEGNWQWITGESISYTKWFSGEPSNGVWNDEGSENYAHFYTWQGDWNDTQGCEKMPFVCEIDSASYTLFFDSNGGNGSMDSLAPQYKEPVTLPTCSFKKTGYMFAGWNLRRDSDMCWYVYSSDAFLSESEIKENGLSKTLYEDGETMWIGGYDGSASYTFVAVWIKPDFVLPSALREVEEEAFAGAAFSYVHVPEQVTKIGKRAFADCPNLRNIDIPAETTAIDATAFEGVSDLTIHGEDGSYAEFYAVKYGFNFVAD